MAVIEVAVRVSKETIELGEGMSAFVGAVKEALSDGWQVGQDVPAVITAALHYLVPAIDGMNQIVDEIVEDKLAFANAVGLSMSKTIEHFIK